MTALKDDKILNLSSHSIKSPDRNQTHRKNRKTHLNPENPFSLHEGNIRIKCRLKSNNTFYSY